MTPDGLIGHIFGAMEGRRHDGGTLAESGLEEKLESVPELTNQFLYADQGYGISKFIITPYKGAQLTTDQKKWNRKMSQARICVEWAFGEVVELWAFVDFKKNLKIGLSPIGQFYLIAVLLTNCHSTLQPNQTSQLFNLDPPNLEQYIGFE